jgi:stage II sporulation protein D
MNFFSIFLYFYSSFFIFLPQLKAALPAKSSTCLVQSALKKTLFTIPIRVLLDQKKLNESCKWEIVSPEGCLVIDLSCPSKKVLYLKKNNTITYKTHIFFNGKKYSSNTILVVPLKGYLSLNGLIYAGAFAITKQAEHVYLVNHLELEDYVLSVVPYESWPGWPLEVNKALCISFRTYGIAKILEQRQLNAKKKKNIPYDIKNSSVHQVYKGINQKRNFSEVIDATRSMVIAHNNKPIVAMFDICCGGLIPAKKVGLNFKHAPYLERTYACNYCKEYKFYRWDSLYSLKELEAGFQPMFKNIKVTDIKITRKDQAGVVQEIAIKNNNKWVTLSSTKFKALVKNLKSLCFTVTKSRLGYTFTGKGHGHHWGLCQWGANQMVREGWDYASILKFYYPGCTLMRLKGAVHARL